MRKTLNVIAANVILLFILTGCSDIPYTGEVLSVNDVHTYLSGVGEDVICLEDGFDEVCVKVIPGESGKDGRDGRDGRDGSIAVVETPYLLLKTPSETFVVMISHGIPEEVPNTYITPVASVEVPVGGGIPEITPVDEPVSVEPFPIYHTQRDPEPSPPNDDDIWHVRFEGRNFHIYPRRLKKRSELPKYNNEIQGTQEQIRSIFSHKDFSKINESLDKRTENKIIACLKDPNCSNKSE